jgi:hypothetical protein
LTSSQSAALARILWGATLVTLPVTSFRYFPAGQGTYVRPLAFLPLALLWIVLIVRLLKRETTIPRAHALVALTAFVLIGFLTSLIGVMLAPLPMRGQEVLARTLRAWATLIMGVAFFLGAAWMNRTEADLRFSVRWLLVGLAANVLWSGVQAATFYLGVFPKPLVTQWQRLFSLRELIRTNRISGMAYEPSWLAGQIATVYMPWLIAAALTRFRVATLRWIEPVLLVAAASLVVATSSRGGILTFAASAGVTILIAGRAEVAAAWKWFVEGAHRTTDRALRVAGVLAAAGIVAAAGLFLAQKGYVSRLWETRASDFSQFLIQNSAGARGAYFTSAFSTYQDYPWTGVGLGASGFYMYDRLPDWALTTVPEIARQLSPHSMLYPNPKNLYLRLLAETGLFGLILFLAFQLALLGDAVRALGRRILPWRYIGVAALCTWLALIFYNMTQDSFATPNLWINLGILSGLTSDGSHQLG